MDKYWDPLRKIYVTATPEEQVRQWFIQRLMDSFHVPPHMMMSEVGFCFGEKRFRADIIVYDRDAAPLMVVECKRPDVKIGSRVVEQAMRYNSVLSVRYIVLTNGEKTYLYVREGSEFIVCDEIPSYDEMLCRQ